MDEQNKDKNLIIRIIVRVLTVLVSIPFAFYIILVAVFSTDAPDSGIIVPLLVIFIPLVLLVTSLFSKKLYWLWLALMIITVIAYFGYTAYKTNLIATKSSNIVASNQKDFDCGKSSSGSVMYLSIKDNGEVVEITTIYTSAYENKLGRIEEPNTLNFTELNSSSTQSSYKERLLNCKKSDGTLLKDAYKNIIFSGK